MPERQGRINASEEGVPAVVRDFASLWRVHPPDQNKREGAFDDVIDARSQPPQPVKPFRSTILAVGRWSSISVDRPSPSAIRLFRTPGRDATKNAHIRAAIGSNADARVKVIRQETA
jgi:hypothetical protein